MDPSTGAARWTALTHDILDMRLFGIVNDNSTDNAPAMAAALAVIEMTGGKISTLLFPPGLYAFRTTVTIGGALQGLKIIGAGRTIVDPRGTDSVGGHTALTWAGNTTSVTDPTGAPTLTPGTGGSLPAGTYYVLYTFKNALGETNASGEASIILSGSNNKITVTAATLPSGATGINVYVGTSTGHEILVGTSSTNTFTYSTVGTVGSNYPALHTNTTAGVMFQFVGTAGVYISDMSLFGRNVSSAQKCAIIVQTLPGGQAQTGMMVERIAFQDAAIAFQNGKGYFDTNCDTEIFNMVSAQNCNTFFRTVNQQGVSFLFNNLIANNCSTVLDMLAGGNLMVNQADFAGCGGGSSLGSDWCIKIGDPASGGGGNVSDYNFTINSLRIEQSTSKVLISNNSPAAVVFNDFVDNSFVTNVTMFSISSVQLEINRGFLGSHGSAGSTPTVSVQTGSTGYSGLVTFRDVTFSESPSFVLADWVDPSRGNALGYYLLEHCNNNGLQIPDQTNAGNAWARAGYAGLLSTISSATTLQATDGVGVVVCTGSGSFTVTLPPAAAPSSGNGVGGSASRLIRVKNVATAGISIAPSGTDLIDGSSTPLSVASKGGAELFCDGVSNWYILAVK